MRLDDPAVVREEYVFEAVAELGPRRILEVGCGASELADRMSLEPGAAVVAIDQSNRMVERRTPCVFVADK